MKFFAFPRTTGVTSQHPPRTAADTDSSVSIRSDLTPDTSITISTEVYKRLLDASVNLIVANETIHKLNEMVDKKNAEIEQLIAKNEQFKQANARFDRLTPVSCFDVHIILCLDAILSDCALNV